MNMSYCRFQNTATDLADCIGALAEIVDREQGAALSEEELRAAQRLVRQCLHVVALVAEEAQLSPDELDAPDAGDRLAECVTLMNDECEAQGGATDQDGGER